MRRSLMILVASLIASMVIGAHSQEARKIEFRMLPGESLTYTMHAETTTEYLSSGSGGKEQRKEVFKSDMQVFMRCIKLSPDGVLDLEITYPDFSMETVMTEGGRTSRIVSDTEGAKAYLDGELQEQLTWPNLEKRGRPNLKKLFSALIGLRLDRTGKVLEVKVPPELATRFSRVEVKDFFRHQVIFPPVPVAPGAEWSESSERELSRGPLRGSIMLEKATYKYGKNETVSGRECARIGIVLSSQPKEEIPDLNEFKQTNEGWSLVSLESGHLVSSEMKLFREIKGTPGGRKAGAKTTGRVRTDLVQPSAAEAAPGQEKTPVDAK